MTHRGWLLATLVVVAACAASSPPTGQSAADQYDPNLPAFQDSASENDAPEISRSQGVAGGVVVLWPRVVLSRRGPATDESSTRAIALKLQQRIITLLHDKFPGVPVDVRPEPERVCPRTGCIGASIGIVLTRSGHKGCTATAWVSAQGASPARLIAWAGGIKLKSERVGFREPPESQVRVVDHAACESLTEQGAAHEPDIESAIRGVMP